MEQKSALSEDLGNIKWRQLLTVFKKLVDKEPPIESVRASLEQLKEEAKIKGILTARQTEGIVSRCNNYLNGDYGNTKRAEHYEQGKPSQK